ncbi:MAG: ATP-binding cassette domain-containing protein [Phaeodactylibacter sp.]|nr:ATP-binding cassette domain-containing protein [Phaeodactylibacter sp.]MCB9276625.1 ATP-binding cassette domain-containing protein [Lewinellaceae bacterium]
MIAVDLLSKSFQRAADVRAGGFSAPRGEAFWALKNVSFRLGEGEAMGIIGPNGAGKSTLLKILAGIYQPTSGRAELRGRVGAILEVGSGFHPELTGRENVYFAARLAGLSRREAGSLLPEIVEFSELEKHLETPVKFYSSGMFLRLAFSTAIHIDCDILLLDEVLAVGDAAFQEKCFLKLQSLRKAGKAMLFASHDPGKLAQMCSRAIVLAEGQLAYAGETQEALAYYARHFAPGAPLPLSQSACLQSISMLAPANDAVLDASKTVAIEIEVVFKTGSKTPHLALALMDSHHNILFSTNTLEQGLPAGLKKARLRWELPAGILNSGLFWANLYVIQDGKLEEHFPKIGKFEAAPFTSLARQAESRFHALHIPGGLHIETQ